MPTRFNLPPQTPEHPELRAFSNFFNIAVQDTVFYNIKQQKIRNKFEILKYPPAFTMTCVHRGKQLKFILQEQNSIRDSIYQEIDTPVLKYSQENKEQ